MKKMKVIFVGRVQGVGFRYTALEFAAMLQIHGTVKNLPDGNVELYAEATQEALDRYLLRLKDHFKRQITHVQIEELPIGVSFPDFRIIH